MYNNNIIIIISVVYNHNIIITLYTCECCNNYSETSDNGHSERGHTTLQRTLFLALNNYLYNYTLLYNTIWTSKKKTTSLYIYILYYDIYKLNERTKLPVPMQSVNPLIYSEVPLYISLNSYSHEDCAWMQNLTRNNKGITNTVDSWI